MKRLNRSRQIAAIALFFAIMLVIHLVTNLIFGVLPVPIKPTLVQIPVIMASIVYGPRIGAILGLLMGIMSVVVNTITLLPTSYLFSPFVTGGNLNSLIIALVPRLLIGVFPYFIYKWLRSYSSPVAAFMAGAIGSFTNTLFVLGGIFILFSQVYNGNIRLMLATVLGTNSLVELAISAFVTMAAIPSLQKWIK